MAECEDDGLLNTVVDDVVGVIEKATA
jgi:hypothetical protein